MLIGFIFMLKFMREIAPEKKSVFSFERVPSFKKTNILYGINFEKDKSGFIGYISKPSKDLDNEDYENN